MRALCVIAFLWLPSPLLSQNFKLVTVNEAIKISLPEDFVKLTDPEINQSYKSYRKPIAVYRQSRDFVDFGINFGEADWPDGDIEIYAKFQKASLKELFSEVNFISEGIKVVNGRKFAFFEMEISSKNEDETMVAEKPIRKYILACYTIVKGRILVFQFNSPLLLKQKWQNTAHKIISSIKITA